VNETDVTFAGDGGPMLSGGEEARPGTAARSPRLTGCDAALPPRVRTSDARPDVAARSSCCPSIAFVTGGPTRDQPHGTLVEQLVAEAGWEARPDVEVLIFSRGGQLSCMEYVHYDADTDVSNAEFPPADELQSRSRN
jgi:hypothetical protein